MTLHVLAFLFGLVASAALVPLCRIGAIRLNCVARPSADRWHKRPTPLLGGVAVVLTVLSGAFAFGIASEVWLLLVAGSLMFAVGVTDDITCLKPSTKLIAEIAVASLLVFFGLRVEWTTSLTLDALLTIFWIVGVTNAFNLLDNMDGLCAGVALIAAVTMVAGLPEAGVHLTLLMLMAGTLGGFLIYNFNPASIFMGDSGSLFLGLMFSAVALQVEHPNRSSLFSVLAAPAVVFLIPIFDTTLVTVLRLLSGRRPSQGGRDHSSHRLVAIGLSERWAVAVLWALAALAGAMGYAMTNTSAAWWGPAVVLLLIAMAIFAVYLSDVRVYGEADRMLVRTGRVTPLIVDFVYKRRVAEVILDACLVSVSYYAAYRLRFDNDEFQLYFAVFLRSLPIVLATQMVAFFVVGVYRGIWRVFGLMDGVTAAKGVALGVVATELIVLYAFRFENYSRGVFIIYAALLMLLVSGSRASFRLMSEFIRRRRKSGARLLIYGAGAGGSLAVRELMENPAQDYRMVGFIDDDPLKQGTRLQGYSVISSYGGLVSLIQGGAVDRVVISTGRIPVNRVTELEALCLQHGVSLSRLQLVLEDLVAVS